VQSFINLILFKIATAAAMTDRQTHRETPAT